MFLTLFTQGQEMWCIPPETCKNISKNPLCPLQDTGELIAVGDPAKASSEGGLSVGLLTRDGHLDFIFGKLWAPRPSISFCFQIQIISISAKTSMQFDISNQIEKSIDRQKMCPKPPFVVRALAASFITQLDCCWLIPLQVMHGTT